jgi:hypothetical protein
MPSLVPFEGRMSYCLIRRLGMVMAQQGHVYPVSWLECVSGEPFGFVYLNDGETFLRSTVMLAMLPASICCAP